MNLESIEKRLALLESAIAENQRLKNLVVNLESELESLRDELYYSRQDADKRIRQANSQAKDARRRVEDMELNAWAESRLRR